MATPTDLQNASSTVPFTNGRGLITGAAIMGLFALIGTILSGMGVWSAAGVFTPNAAPGTFRTLQSFNAVGDGLADDTVAVGAALNSGAPIVCDGTFLVSSLVSVTNKDVYIQGAHNDCRLILSTPTAMISGTFLPTNKVFTKDVSVLVKAAITSVPGAPHTAAFDWEFPGGGVHNGADISVNMTNTAIIPDQAGHYIAAGVYLFDANVARLINTTVIGDTGTLRPISGIVYDGISNPTTFYAEDSFGADLYYGINLPLETVASSSGSGPWQGARVKNFDCVACAIPVQAIGGSAGTSDYIEITGLEGYFNTYATNIQNVGHVFFHHNYTFMAAIAGAATPASVSCFSYTWSINTTSKPELNVDHNACDGNQISGTTRVGVNVQGQQGVSMASVIGTNTLNTLDFGVALQAGTSGVLVYPQSTSGVTTPISNAATANANSQITATPF